MESVLPVAKRIHPLLATAAVAVTLVSAAGVAAITGLLPSSHSTSAPTLTRTTPLPDSPAVSAAPAPAPVHTHAAVAAPHHSSSVPHASPVRQQLAQQAAPRPAPIAAPAVVKPAPVCNSCGRVESVATIPAETESTSGLGVAAGAVLGGLLGHQVGGGNGRTLATVAGAVGGSLAGNEVERRARAAPASYQVRVRMEDGSIRSFPYSAAPNWNAGDRVQIINGQLSNQG